MFFSIIRIKKEYLRAGRRGEGLEEVEGEGVGAEALASVPAYCLDGETHPVITTQYITILFLVTSSLLRTFHF